MKNHIVFVAVFLWLVSAFAATAPAAWKFVATGDSRGDDHGVNTEILGEIANEIVAAGGVELVVVPGDLITSGGTNQFQTWRDTMAPVYNAGIEVYPIRGNHDDDNDAAWITKFGADIPDNGPSGAVNYTYYVEHNNALFIGFDNYIGSYGRIPVSPIPATMISCSMVPGIALMLLMVMSIQLWIFLVIAGTMIPAQPILV